MALQGWELHPQPPGYEPGTLLLAPPCINKVCFVVPSMTEPTSRLGKGITVGYDAKHNEYHTRNDSHVL